MSEKTPRSARHRKVSVDLSSKAPRTEQHHKKAVSTQGIMDKSAKTGMIEHVRSQAPTYADMASMPDYHAAMNLVASATGSFNTIPAQIRERFDNDPGKWLGWINDEQNRAEMIELGFGDDHLPPAPEDPEPTPVAPEPPATA